MLYRRTVEWLIVVPQNVIQRQSIRHKDNGIFTWKIVDLRKENSEKR